MNTPAPEIQIPHVTLRQLQIFEAVVRLGGHTRAADALFLTQPTVSMQISKLGETLGLTLFEQIGRKVYPTAEGRRVYEMTREILTQVVALGDLESQLKGVVRGQLNIAVITSASYFMPHLMGAFVEQHPKVQPCLTVGNRAKVLERLRSNQDDLLIMGQVPDDLAVRAHPFIDNEIVVVAPPGHPLQGRADISLGELSGERFLIREAGSGTRQAVDRLFEGQGIGRNIYMELGNVEAIKQAVMAGLGIATLSRSNLGLELASGHIAILDVVGFPLVRRWYAVHLRGKKLSLASQSFLSYLLEESGTILSQGGLRRGIAPLAP